MWILNWSKNKHCLAAPSVLIYTVASPLLKLCLFSLKLQVLALHEVIVT